tara:strand:- start:2418 stop:2612 length:195 start_codon:yes stop_codon:yes gene_type:complete
MTIKCNHCVELEAEIRKLEKAVAFWEEQEFQLGLALGIYNKAMDADARLSTSSIIQQVNSTPSK